MRNSKENKAIIKALKKINECRWVGTVKHDNLQKCLSALILQSANSGWYKPIAGRIDGLAGIFMINEDGSIYWESRIIKEQENVFTIEHLTTSGCNDFENLYAQFINESAIKTNEAC